VIPFERDLAVVETNRVARGISIAMLASGLAIAVAMIALRTQAVGLGAPFIALGGLGWFLTSRWNVLGKRRPARVRADAEGVRVGGELVARRSDITDAFVLPSPGHAPLVRFLGKGRRVLCDVEVTSEAEGKELLRAAELDVTKRAVTFHGASPMYQTRAGPWLVALAMIVAMVAWLFVSKLLGIVPLPLPVLIPLLALVPTRIRVGADGVATSWLGMFRKFFSYAEMTDVHPTENGVELALRSGKKARIATTPARPGNSALSLASREALLARLQEGREAFAQHRDAEASALVARGSRAIDEWLTALRELGSAGYRDAALPRETLWRIAEDPTADPTARAGAAVALRSKLDDAERTRLRDAAEATVAPRIRVALEAAAEDDDDRVAAALKELT
jgi:hypothetical protein